MQRGNRRGCVGELHRCRQCGIGQLHRTAIAVAPTPAVGMAFRMKIQSGAFDLRTACVQRIQQASRRIKLTHVARIFEMIEKGFAVQGLSLFFIMQLDTGAL